MFKTDPLFSEFLPEPTNRGRAVAKTVRYHFADVADMLNHVPAEKPEGAWHDGAWTNSNSFSGAGMSEALDMARQGWPEGAERAQKLREGIHASLPQAPKLARYDVAGSLPSIPRALAGNPMAMRRVVIADTRRMPTITLACNSCVSAMHPAEEMVKHAAALAAVVDLLEDAGYRVEVYNVAISAEGEEVASEVAVCAKRAEEPVNLSALAYSIGHVAAFRRLVFAIWGKDKDSEKLGCGLGTVQPPVKPNADSGVFSVPSSQDLGEGMENIRDAVWRFHAILKHLRAAGCPGIPDTGDLPKPEREREPETRWQEGNDEWEAPKPKVRRRRRRY